MRTVHTVTLLLLQGLCVLAAYCPGSDWLHRPGTDRCYFVYDPKAVGAKLRLSHQDALEECHNRGGHIATFASTGELDWIAGHLTDPNLYFWIGLTYESGAWQWHNGAATWSYEPIAGLNLSLSLYPTESNRGSLKYSFANNAFVFQAKPDWDYNGFVCKGEWSSKSRCNTDDGWRYFNGTCRKMHTDLKTWKDAQAACRLQQNGHLLTITNRPENDDTKYWLRSEPDLSETWLGIEFTKATTSTTKTVRWVDGVSIAEASVNVWQTNITTFIRDAPTGRSYCGMLTTTAAISATDYEDAVDNVHYWNLTDDCNNRLPFVCEKPAASLVADGSDLLIPPAVRCNPPSLQFHGGCYLPVRQSRNRDAAQKYCADQGGHIAYPEAFGENVWLQSLVKSDIWLGVERAGHLDSTKEWQLSDGEFMEPRSFRHFRDPIREVAFTDQNFCVAMANASGRWLMSNCTAEKEFVCRLDGGAVLPLLPEVSQNGCAVGWVRNRDSCYSVFVKPVFRNRARQFCQNLGEGADLVSILSRTEDAFLDDLVATNYSSTDQYFWIGLISKVFGSGQWFWQAAPNQYPITFTDWVSGEPQDGDGDEFFWEDPLCATMDNHPRQPAWFSADCTEQHGFICKKTVATSSEFLPRVGSRVTVLKRS